MIKKVVITFKLLAEWSDKKERAVETYFYRKGWSIKNIDHVYNYLIKHLK